MAAGGGRDRTPGRGKGTGRSWMALTAVISVVVASGISWALVSNVAAAKSQYASDMTRIDNSIGHLKDAAAAIDTHVDYQDNAVQTRLDGIDGQVTGISNDLADKQQQLDTVGKDVSKVKDGLSGATASIGAVKSQTDSLSATVTTLNTTINDASTGLVAKVNSLSTTVGSVNSLQVVPTIAAGTGGGTISLAINSTQALSQLVAFQINFWPTSDVPESATMDVSMAALYGAPPVTLNPGGSGYAALPAANTVYNLYWSSGAYHLGSIAFTTFGTSISQGSQTKTLAFTYAGSTAYEVAVTPLFESAATSTGGTARSW